MMLKIETFSLQIRRVSVAFVAVLNNAYSFDFYPINKNKKVLNIKMSTPPPSKSTPPPSAPPAPTPPTPHDFSPCETRPDEKMDQPVQDDGSPSGLEADQRVLPVTPPERAQKLTSHEWTVTNEVCSLLDDVSEATIRMQGAGDTYVNQAMYIMTEVFAMLKEESHPIRVPNATILPPPSDGIPTESTDPGS